MDKNILFVSISPISTSKYWNC